MFQANKFKEQQGKGFAWMSDGGSGPSSTNHSLLGKPPNASVFSPMNYGIVAWHTVGTQSMNAQELDSFKDIFQLFTIFNSIHFCEK